MKRKTLLGIGAGLCAGLAPALASADPSFGYPPQTAAVSASVRLGTVDWVWDQGSAPPTARYSPNLDQRVRIFGSPYSRSATVSFASGAALFPVDTTDAIELGWFGAPPSSIETGATSPVGSMSVPVSGANSLMNPGAQIRFRSGAAPATVGMQSETSGFAVSTVTIAPNANGTIGSVNVPTLSPYERGVFILNANDHISDLALPVRQSNERSTFAAWLNSPTSIYAGQVGVWARCGAFPDSANFDEKKFFASNTPVFFELGACQSHWFVTIGSTAPVPMVVHATSAANFTSRIIPFMRVGVKFNATPTEKAGIERAFRSAAWRVYGMTMGHTLFKEFWFYNNSSCNRIDGCGTGCNICVTPEACGTNVSRFDGYMTLCNDVTSVIRTNNVALIEPQGGPAHVIAHEFGHQWLGQPDEYWDDTPCGDQGLCGHTIMELLDHNRHGICTDANHRMHPEDRRTSWDRINGPIGFACNGAAGWVDGASGWARMAGMVPGAVLPSFGAQNVNYSSQGFVGLSDLGDKLWVVP